MSTTFVVFNVQLTASLLVFALAARWYVWPWLVAQDRHHALVPPLLVGALRFMGLMFLVPSVTPGMPEAFALPTGLGDAASAALALAAAVANRSRSPLGRPLAAAYLLLGGGELALGFVQGFRYALWDHLDGAWTYICFGAPASITSLALLGALLVRRR